MQKHILLAGLTIAAISQPTSVMAARDWRITPILSLRQTYSDNIILAPPGQEEDAFVSELNPGFSLNRQGSRSKFDLSYRLQSLFYEGYDRDPQLNNQLQMNSNTELVDEAIFLDSSSSIGQANTSSTGRFNFNNISDSGNTTEFRTFRLSPYWRPHWGRYADGEVRLSYGTFSTSGGRSNNLSDSNIIEERVQFRNGDASLPFGWRVNFSNQDSLRNQSASAAGTSNDVRFQNYNGEVSYRLTSGYSVFAQAGRFDNQFPGATSTRRAVNGSYYTVGVAWTPSPKFSLSVGGGISERQTTGRNSQFSPNYFTALAWRPSQRTTLSIQFRETKVGGAPGSTGVVGTDASGLSGIGVGTGFGQGSQGFGTQSFGGLSGFDSSPFGQLGGFNAGTTWSGLLQHSTRTTTWSASYDVSTTTIQQLLFNQQVFTPGSTDNQGNVIDPILNPRPTNLPNFTDDIITRKRAQVSVSKSFSKNTVTLSGYQENRSSGSIGPSTFTSQDVLGFTATWNWRVTQLMNSILQGSWQQIDSAANAVSGIPGKSEYLNLGLVLSRQISSHLNGVLELRHFQQDGIQGLTFGRAGNKYNENRVTASVNVRF